MRTEEQRAYNRTIPGWFGLGDLMALDSLASTVINGTIIELGSMHGRSAYCLAKASINSIVYCYDFWPACPVVTADGVEGINSLEVFLSNVKDCPNIIPTHLEHENAKWHLDTLVDMVFIDASHTNPNDWECIEYWLPKIKSGGILCGHDYYTMERDGKNEFPDVVTNVRRLEELLDRKVNLFDRSCVWSIDI
jgi:predicted O-methyltransferase YrrM